MAPSEAQPSAAVQRPRAASPAPTGAGNAGGRPGDAKANGSAEPPAAARAKAPALAACGASGRGSAKRLVLSLVLALACSSGAYLVLDEWVPQGDASEAAFINSSAMTIVTELGDKTFFIAALLAMRHGPKQVFLGAYTALVIMTIISSCVGSLSSSLLSPWYTHWAATLLFVYFGGAGLLESARLFRAGEGEGPSGELEEVKMSLKDDAKKNASVVFQALSLTFLAEWGDKSQVSTIALSSAGDPVGVTLGGFIGHLCCTSLAVFGGHAFAERISERVVVAIAGLLFLGFGILGITTGVPQ